MATERPRRVPGGPSPLGDTARPLAALGERAHPSTLPTTGAWRPGDEVGNRQFASVAPGRGFALEGGGALYDTTIAYETFGELDADGGNAILICHALTGDSHVSGGAGPGHVSPGWWSHFVGPGRPIDTNRWFVVCPNTLGGCQGSTGPASPHPDDGAPYGSRFPVVSIRDMVRSQAVVADAVGVARWHTVIGGSMGGMQALEWGVMYPERVGSILAIATVMEASAQQIGWWSVGRRIIRMDPDWNGGDYYDGIGPHEGLALARMVSQITFRSDELFTGRFGREVVEPLDGGFQLWQRFQVERYLEYHGDKLVRRFDANSYLVLTKAMDLHDIARGRGGVDSAMRRITAPIMTIGIDSDILYPAHQARSIAETAQRVGLPAVYCELHSPHGHDAFLLESESMASWLIPFLDDPAHAVRHQGDA